MDDQSGDVAVNDHALSAATAPANGRMHCDICQRRLGKSIFFVEETGDVPDEHHAWALCEECHTAVHERLVASPVRTSLRLRIAVGLVAAERTPEARRSNFGQMTDESWIKVFLWLFPITMIVHLLIIVVIAGVIK